jgi:hypothetical protein
LLARAAQLPNEPSVATGRSADIQLGQSEFTEQTENPSARLGSFGNFALRLGFVW